MSHADITPVACGRTKRAFTRNPFVTGSNRAWCEEHGEDDDQMNAEDGARDDEDE